MHSTESVQYVIAEVAECHLGQVMQVGIRVA